MYNIPINQMDFKQLRNEVQLLRDELALMQRKYEDILNNLDRENFSSTFVREQDDMKTAIAVTAEGIQTLAENVSKNGTKISTLEQTADGFETEVQEIRNDMETEIDSMKSSITQNADSISLVVSGTGKDGTINTSSIIQAINGDTSSVSINANKVNLNAYAKTDEVSEVAQTAAQETASEAISELTLISTNGTSSSTIKLLHNETLIDSATVKFTGVVTFSDLETAGSTEIDGSNITTGTISADRIDTENLSCTRMYAKNNPNGYHVKLNGDWGDFGIFNSSASDSANATSTKCMFGIYQADAGVVDLYVYGDNFLTYDQLSEKTRARGTWDFSDATVSGIKAVFG